MHILSNVGRRRGLEFWALAAVLLSVLGTLHAQGTMEATGVAAPSASQTYVVSLPSHCKHAAKVEVTLGPSGTHATVVASAPAETRAALPKNHVLVATASSAGGWEVSIAVDTSACKLYCTYRHRSGWKQTLALAALSPKPQATVQIFDRLRPVAETVVLDPSGMQDHGKCRRARLAAKNATALSRRWMTVAFAPGQAVFAPLQHERISSLFIAPPRPVTAALPLRV